MADHPKAVMDKAQRVEQLLLRVAQGEPLEELCAELDLAIDPGQLARLRAKYVLDGRTWEVLIDGRYGHPFKADSVLREWLYERKRQDKGLTAPALVKAVKAQFGVELSAGHINYLLRKVELTHPPGRPFKRPAGGEEPTEPEAASHALDNAGLFFPGGCKAGPGGHAGDGDLPGDGSPAA